MRGLNRLLVPLNRWLTDPKVQELAIQEPGSLWVEFAGGAWQKETVPTLPHTWLTNLCQLIANNNRQILNEAYPLLSGALPTGERIQIILPPTAKHPTLCIRKPSVNRLQLKDYQTTRITDHAIKPSATTLLHLYQTHQYQAFLTLAIQQRKTLVIVGGTGSGKTTLLNACLAAIPSTERLVTLEDVREVNCTHPNIVSLLAVKNMQGKANVTLQDLLQASLRLKPDRIIMGEIRGIEIRDFLTACHTGHPGSLTTLHANDVNSAVMRMTQLYKQQPTAMSDADIRCEIQSVVDAIICVRRTNTGFSIWDIDYQDTHDGNNN
jgi:type IV secretion system protein VirB11